MKFDIQPRWVLDEEFDTVVDEQIDERREHANDQQGPKQPAKELRNMYDETIG